MAGLSTSKSSLANIYDISPPVAGHVYDGKSDAVSPHSKDIDYQTDMSQLSVYWEGFYDPHSVIKCYRVYIGTCSGCYDIINEQVVGAHTCKYFNPAIASHIDFGYVNTLILKVKLRPKLNKKRILLSQIGLECINSLTLIFQMRPNATEEHTRECNRSS